MDKAVKKNKEIIAKFEICISKGKNMKESRHAYMIMAHNDFDMLYEILRELDYRRNDIFLHIDRKSQNVPIEHLCSAVKEAADDTQVPIKTTLFRLLSLLLMTH